MEFTVRNEWVGPSGNGETLEVFAGGVRVDPGGSSSVRPAVRTFILSRDQGGHDTLTPGATYADTSANGPLSVTSVDGALMRLRTDEGQSVTFDLGAMTFR
jgi:hypothetical protein